MHSFLGKYYADIMTLFALLSPFLLIFYNQKSSKKSQLDENSERWMERLRQSSIDFSKNLIELYWLNNDSKELNNELSRWPGEISLISIRASRAQKTMEVKSTAISSQTRLSLYFSEDSETLEKISPVMDKCLTLALNTTTAATEFSETLDEFLSIIDERIAKEWKQISKSPNNFLLSGVAILCAVFLTTTVIQFAEIGKLQSDYSQKISTQQTQIDSLVYQNKHLIEKLNTSKMITAREPTIKQKIDKPPKHGID